MKTIIYRDKKKEWHWTVFARNGHKIAGSVKGYKRRAAMSATLRNFRRYFANTQVYLLDTGDEWK